MPYKSALTQIIHFFTTPRMSIATGVGVVLITAGFVLGWPEESGLSPFAVPGPQLAFSGIGLIFLQACLGGWGTSVITARQDPFATLPEQESVDYLISREHRVFSPHLMNIQVMLPTDADYDKDLAQALRNLREAGDYVVTDAKGITQGYFIEIKTGAEYRRKAIRRANKPRGGGPSAK